MLRRIRPGKGNSTMAAVGSGFAAVFGVFWTMMAISMGAPIFFAVFGVVFVVMGIVQCIIHIKNAVSNNPMSLYDITDDRDNRDDLDLYASTGAKNFCPYCGKKLNGTFRFCPGCGKGIITNKFINN